MQGEIFTMLRTRSLLLLILVPLFFTTPLHTVSPKHCKPVARAMIEEKFGKAIKCPQESKGIECFGPQQEPVRVQFDSLDAVTNIELSSACHGLQFLKKVLNETVPNNARGKYLRGSEPLAPYSCRQIHEEEYQCVRITYSEELCMGCAPARIEAKWK